MAFSLPLGSFLRPSRGLAVFCGLLLSVSSAQARIETEAIIGQPYGVGRITIDGAEAGRLDDRRVLLREANNRVHYPSVSPGLFGRLLEGILGNPVERPTESLTIFFLFDGAEPLEITLATPGITRVTIRPTADRDRTHQRRLAQWWREYQAMNQKLKSEGDHVPLVQTYLESLLRQRLALEPRRLGGLELEGGSKTQASIELLMGFEKQRLKSLQETMLGKGDFGQVADLPLPADLVWPQVVPAQLAGEGQLEALASHVPAECFYIRYGKFSNYLWMNALIEENGGDLASLLTLRSYFAPLNKKVQEQLGLEQNVLASIVGDQVIADVALIGRDLFVADGAAIGVLFQAKQSALLGSDLMNQRKRAVERLKQQGAVIEPVELAGVEASLASTPDNKLRSYYVSDGDFHLVTTSKTMAVRFLEAGQGKNSLAQQDAFRGARATFPIAREDTIFVYFSPAFFEGLLSPQYQIETQRRMQAVTDLEALKLAQLASLGEGRPATEIADLVRSGFLPAGFGRRPDGGGPILSGADQLDSRRGARGSFLPVPDVKIAGVTRAERERFDTLAAAYEGELKRMDPVMLAIRRTALNDSGLERIAIDGHIEPLDETKFGWFLNMLGPPTTQMVSPVQGDIVSAQGHIKGMNFLRNIPPHHMFLGVQDIEPLLQGKPQGLMGWLQMLRGTPGYLGTWPQAGYLDMLPLGLAGQPDAYGFSQLPLGLWRRQGGGFSVLSFDYNVLAGATPQLRIVESEIPAQMRLHVNPLHDAKLAGWINRLYYERGLVASAGNVRLLHLMQQQLGVPAAEARKTAEELLSAQLRCPLGGDYELVEEPGGATSWISTAWHKGRVDAVPDDYKAPPLKWFRGLDAHLTKDDGRLVARLELDMQRPPAAPKVALPLFDLFGGGQKAFKPKNPSPKAEELPPPALPPVPKGTPAPKTEKREF